MRESRAQKYGELLETWINQNHEARINSQLNKVELATILGVTPMTVSMWEEAGEIRKASGLGGRVKMYTCCDMLEDLKCRAAATPPTKPPSMVSISAVVSGSAGGVPKSSHPGHASIYGDAITRPPKREKEILQVSSDEPAKVIKKVDIASYRERLCQAAKEAARDYCLEAADKAKIDGNHELRAQLLDDYITMETSIKVVFEGRENASHVG